MRQISFLVAAALMFFCAQKTLAADCSDLSLVLAIDSSSSIDKTEFKLQLDGFAAAFASREVQHAISQTGVVDVAIVFWGDSQFGFQVVPWVRVDSARASDEFAARILTTRRKVVGDTDIGDGLSKALDLLDMPGRCTAREVVNVSGDGRASLSRRNSNYVAIADAKARASRMGVEVNGLAVTNEEPGLADYYRKEMIVGAGSFVMEATSFTEFKDAILRKLVREISPTLSASLDETVLVPSTLVP